MAQKHEPALLSLLSNTLILLQLSPYLPISSLLGLARTSKAFHDLIFDTTASVFKHLDLSTARGAAIDLDLPPIDRGGESWRAERMDEALTEEDFYGGPLRGILSFLKQKNILQGVQTLILDGVSAPSEVLHDVICESQYRVKILSLIGCKNLNERKLVGTLKYAVRSTRPSGTPVLKGLYIFGTELPKTRRSGRDLPNKKMNLILFRATALEPWCHTISRSAVRSLAEREVRRSPIIFLSHRRKSVVWLIGASAT